GSVASSHAVPVSQRDVLAAVVRPYSPHGRVRERRVPQLRAQLSPRLSADGRVVSSRSRAVWGRDSSDRTWSAAAGVALSAAADSDDRSAHRITHVAESAITPAAVRGLDRAAASARHARVNPRVLRGPNPLVVQASGLRDEGRT